MKYPLRQSKPVPWDQIINGPVGDARWRTMPEVGPEQRQRIDRLRLHEQIQAARPNPKAKRGINK